MNQRSIQCLENVDYWSFLCICETFVLDKTYTYRLFLCVFEKLTAKKTQAPKKLKVFSAQKLKLPEVFRSIFQNSIDHRKKKKISPLFCLKTWNFLKIKGFWAETEKIFNLTTRFPKKSKLKQFFSETLNKIRPKTQGTEGFYHSHPLENRTKKACDKRPCF